MTKTRGFKKISLKQFEKDFIDYLLDPETWEDESIDDKKYRLNKTVKIPKRGTAMSAGYDVFTPFGFTLKPKQDINIPTGLKAYMQPDEVLFAYPRSGMGFKYYVRLANTIGVVDMDYFNNEDNEGHIWIKIRNEGNKVLEIRKGQAIVQFIFQKYLLVDGDNFEGEKRKGGFGSTD
ncbi:MAG: deoxyuridine 5'-triphosphate nucleotidohydrolase [bacterium]